MIAKIEREKRLKKFEETKFAKGGLYGHIFDPDEPKYRNLGDFTRIYFNADLKKDRLKDLMKAFLEMVQAVKES